MNTKIFTSLSFAILLTIFFNTSASAQCANSSSHKTNYYQKIAHESDIIDLAISSDDLSTLVAAVKTAGLVDVLKGNGPFTVFAPINQAFSDLPEGTVESLLKPENRDELTKILTYHVIPGKISSKDLANGLTAQTVQGEKIMVNLNTKGAFINGSRVIKADIEAANGIIHLIDAVILPLEK